MGALGAVERKLELELGRNHKNNQHRSREEILGHIKKLLRKAETMGVPKKRIKRIFGNPKEKSSGVILLGLEEADLSVLRGR